MSSGRYQLLVKGTEDSYLTGTPQITYFRSMYNKVSPFIIRYNENPFYSYGSAYGGSQVCKINTSGDIARNNFLKITLPSLFIPTSGWCFPTPSTQFTPAIYLLNESFTVTSQSNSKSTVVYYNTVMQSWLPPYVTYVDAQNKFNFSFATKYIGFKTLDESLFWGFKNYIFYKNGYYIFNNSTTSELSLVNSGWVNSYYKYFRSYIDSVGSKIIDRIEFYIGGQLIENIPGDFLILYKDLTVPEQLQESLNKLEGSVSTSSTSDSVYYVWIPISLTNIPLCSLYRQDVEFRISFRNFTDLIDPKYLNKDPQTLQLPFTANAVVYNADAPYFINETGIFSQKSNITLTESVIPNASILVKSNIYLLGTSNLLIYNIQSNAVTKVSYTKSHTVKQSVGIIFAVNLFNFTRNGIAQKIVGSVIYEYQLPVTTITLVKYHNSLIFVFNDNIVYVHTNDLVLIQTFTFDSTVTSTLSSSNTVYFITRNSIYQYNLVNFIIVATLPPNFGTIIDASYTGGEIYICNSSIIYGALTQTTILDRSVTQDITSMQIYAPGGYFVYTLRGVVGVYLFTAGTLPTAIVPQIGGLTQKYVRGFIPPSNTKGVWISDDNIIATTEVNSAPSSFNEQYIGISSSVSFAYDPLSTLIYIADGAKIYQVDTLRNICTLLTFTPLTDMAALTMAYDGTKIYILPSNGTSNIVVYNTTSPVQNESFTTLRIKDAVLNSDKSLYVRSSYYDGKSIHMLPSAQDSNIVVYNTLLNIYTITDFVKTTVSIPKNSTDKNYTPQNITASTVLGNDMFMFYDKGFYRYDTTLPAEYKLSVPSPKMSNVFVSVYDRINSNVYYFSSNLALDGLLYSSTSVIRPDIQSSKIYNSTAGNIYSSACIFGSYIYLVPRIGNSIIRILKTNVYSFTTFTHTLVPNASNTSYIFNSNLYCFPGPSHGNVIVFDLLLNTFSNLTIRRDNYTSAAYDGYSYGYVFTANNITRFNTTGDVFVDYAGYSNLSANTMLRTTNFTSNNYFIGTSNILKYDVASNSYNLITNYNTTNVVGVSEYINANIFILSNTGNISFLNTVSNSITTTIKSPTVNGRPVDICGNAQYIFTLYNNSNVIGRLDLNGDVNGIGYYSNLSNTSNCTGNITSIFNVGPNIYTVFDTSNISIFNINSNIFSNIQMPAKNTYSAFTVYNSNIFVLPLVGNVMVEFPSQTNRFLSNISNITGGTASPGFMYLCSNSSSNIVEYVDISSYTTYSLPSKSNNSACYYLDSNVFFFPYDTNSISVYDTRTVNFTNKTDNFNQVKMGFANVISTYNTFCLTDDYKLFSIDPDNPTYSVPIYLKSLMTNQPQITIPYNTNTRASLLFDSLGTWTFDFPYNAFIAVGGNTLNSTRPTYTVTRIGFVNDVSVTTSGVIYVYKPNDQTRYTCNFYERYAIDTTRPMTTITSEGMISSNTATKMYSIFKKRVYSQNLKNSLNFSNSYSTPTSTYMYNDTVNSYDSLVVYNNLRNYVNPVQRFDTNFNRINAIGHQGLPGSTTIYMITNSSNLVRFDELYDAASIATPSQFTQIQNVTITPGSQIFKLSDGVGVITNSNIYGVGIQSLWRIGITDVAITNPIFIASNLYVFSSTNIIVYNNISRISDLDPPTLTPTRTSLTGYAPFRRAFYDTNKYLIVSTVGNVLAYDTTTQLSTTANLVAIAKTWTPGPGSVLYNSNSFIPSSNTNDLLILYSSSFKKAYTEYKYPKPPIITKRVKFLSNVAYMLGDSNIVSYDMKSNIFGYTPTLSTNYLFEQKYIIYTGNINGLYYYTNPSPSNIYSSSYDGRYINILTGSNIVQFDTISNNFTYKPSTANATIQVGSNIYFYVTKSNVISYSSVNRSYTTVNVPDACDGLSLYDSNVYFASKSNIYKMNIISFTDYSVIYSNTFSNIGKTTKFGNQMAFTFNSNTVVLVNGNTGSNVTITTSCTFTNLIFDSYNNFYLAGNSIARYSNGSLTTTAISNTFPVPNYSYVGAGLVYNSNLYTLSNKNEYIIYKPKSNIFVTTDLPLTTNSITNTILGSNLYLPPGSNTNVIQVYDMTKPFVWSNAYSNIKSSTTNVISCVTTGDTVYYVSNTTGNLVTYNGTTTSYVIPSSNAASFGENNIYFSNATGVTKLMFTPIISPRAFKNTISFSQQSNIYNILVTGPSVYTIGDVVYKIDYKNLQLEDVTQVFQPSSNNKFSSNTFNCAYFDGRFLGFATNSVTTYDTLTFDYPKILSPSIITEYVYFQDDERKKFLNSDLKYIITQLQRANIPSSGKYSINFLNLLSELIFVGDLSRVSMYLNGHERFSCDADYLKNIQPYLYHTRKPTGSNISMYSFCTNPEEELPEGYLNASRIKDKVFDFQISSNLIMYGLTKNILTIKDGLGGLVFNNSTE